MHAEAIDRATHGARSSPRASRARCTAHAAESSAQCTTEIVASVRTAHAEIVASCVRAAQAIELLPRLQEQTRRLLDENERLRRQVIADC